MDQANQTQATFRTTSWTMIVRARAEPEELDALLKEYWPPMYACYRAMRYSREDACDLVQDFILCKFLEGELKLLHDADPARGSFRALLRRSLKNFAIDRRRAARAGARGGGARIIPLDADLDAIEPDERDDPETAYSRQFAATILERVLERLEAQCRAEGMSPHWIVFEAKVIRPANGSCEALDMSAIAAEAGADSPDKASSMLYSVKRKFESVLREVVAEQVANPRDVEAELAELNRLWKM